MFSIKRDKNTNRMTFSSDDGQKIVVSAKEFLEALNSLADESDAENNPEPQAMDAAAAYRGYLDRFPNASRLTQGGSPCSTFGNGHARSPLPHRTAAQEKEFHERFPNADRLAKGG